MLMTILAGLIVDGLWGSAGSRDLLILRQHSSALGRERDALIVDNAVFRQQIARLKSDDACLQRLIREELGFVRRGETVYRFSITEPP
jgi:cell division protein FtsB